MVAELVLGPLLRHVDQRSATIWVETSGPCVVEIASCRAATFQVSGHHYALVTVTGLVPDTITPYEVRLDGAHTWPMPDSEFPQCRIRTVPEDPARPHRMVFGSCRKPQTAEPKAHRMLGTDALEAYARRMAQLPERDWPDSLLLLGDQVYADETTRETQQWLRRRRDVSRPPGTEVATFEEYVRLYHESWGSERVRWLLSTVPTSMIFDDHDVRDDWNTSQTWRDTISRQPWWGERIRGALMSYWVYQHIGNLGPQELASDGMFQAVTAAGSDTDIADLLSDFADRADVEVNGTKGAQWSYRRDFGRVRLLVIDTRSGRILRDNARSMISDDEFHWIENNAEGDLDHLLIGSSLPWLMPYVIHHIESLNEVGARAPGRTGRWAEQVRQAVDLEHWPAFQASSARLARLIERIGKGSPATVCVLSGDVHHGYTARVEFQTAMRSEVHQLVCSPIHNVVPTAMKAAFRLSWWEPLARLVLWWSGRRGLPQPPVNWRKTSGPHFGNAVATLELCGREATMTLEHAREGAGGPELIARPPVRLTS